jgi:hypothetical protein
LILIVLRVRFNVSAVGVTVYSISVIVGAILIEPQEAVKGVIVRQELKVRVCGMKNNSFHICRVFIVVQYKNS